MTVTETRPPATRAPTYVGGLDGLRAIAVAGVIVFHFAPSVLPAGFLGVDVFFVVSGFLIARLVMREMSGSGTVSLVNFWARRARRLLPALATVVVVVLIATAIVFSDIEVHDIRAQALGTLFYVANWVLIAGKNNYFSTVGRPSPFLHMWTLAVEEQFYLVLPLVFFAARRFILRHPARTAVLALAGAVASTIWMGVLFSPGGDPTRAYLGTDSHAMGLLVGVAIGVIAGNREGWDRVVESLRPDTAIGRAAPWVAAACLVAVVVTMRVASERSDALYRGGGFLAFAVLCGVIVTVLAARPDTGLSRGLGTSALVAVGLRSYSLYIWHWPVRVFVTPSSGLHGFGLFVVRLVVSAVLAEISFRLVEQPLRIGRPAQRAGSRPAVAYYAAMVVIAIVLVLSVDAPQALPPSSLSQLGPAPSVPAANQPGAGGPKELRVDLFGDSQGLVFGLGGAYHAKELGITVGGDASLGCGLVQTDHLSAGQLLKNPDHCRGWEARWRAIMRREPKSRLAVMAGAWETLDQQTANGTARFGTPEWTNLITASVRDALTVLTSDGRTVHLFQVPCFGTGDANDPLPERHDPARIAAVNEIFENVARSMENVKIVPWRDLVCPGGQRKESIDGVHLWQPDDQHLTYPGAVIVWKWWLPQLRASS